MRILFIIVSIFIVVSVIFIAFLNTQTAFELNVWSLGKVSTISYHTNLINLIFAVFVAGILAGALWAGSFHFSSKAKLKEYQKKLEKTSVQSSADSSKVDVLEAKIEVLEKALKTALEKNNE